MNDTRTNTDARPEADANTKTDVDPAMIVRSRLVTRTRDTAVARNAILHTFRVRGLDVTGSADFSFEETLTGTSLLALESTSCTGTVRGEVDASASIIIVWLKAGRAVVDGQQLPVGRPVLYHGRQQVQWDRSQKDLMRMDQSIVEQVAAERGGWEPGPLEFKPNHVPEGAPLAAWWLMVRTIASDILATSGNVPLEREHELAVMAATGLLTAIPHWPADRRAEQPPESKVGRAEAFILEHVGDPITLQDVAAAAGLSDRGLQAAFQRTHGTTPMGYLRGVRLLMARTQLESGDAVIVTDVARASGIMHLGRFSAAYREAFGELPGETLRAARHTTPTS